MTFRPLLTLLQVSANQSERRTKKLAPHFDRWCDPFFLESAQPCPARCSLGGMTKGPGQSQTN